MLRFPGAVGPRHERVRNMNIAGVILAAGRGRRFGGDKLLARLPGGATVIAQTARRMAAAVTDYVCVVRADDQPLQQHLQQLQIPWIVAPEADAGMSQSLIAGIRHCSDADAWLIGLGDMPYVEPETCQQLCQRWQQQSREVEDERGWIVIPAVADGTAGDGVPHLRRGNPVLFGRQWGPALNRLSGDVGGKAVIAANPGQVLLVRVTDRNILRDIDTPEDIC